jgi:hypothetical protein
VKVALGGAVVAAVVLAAAACGGSAANPGPRAVRSDRDILGGAIRCTATLRSPVEIGQDLGVSVTFRNVSDHMINVYPAYGGVWVLVKSADGTTYDTRVPLENSNGPPPSPIPVRPGATVTRHLLGGVRIRWAGPLTVTPGCDVSAAPTVRVAVTSPGLPASETKAVNDVVAATGHLLDKCRPVTPGVSVVGWIDPPSDAPPLLAPLQARCSISLRKEPGFYDAQVLVLTPPDLQGVHVQQPYETLSGTNVRHDNTQALAWEFVVTQDGATSVSSADYETSRPGGRRIPEWFWLSSGAKKAGDIQCGGSGGGSGNGPLVSFMSACGSGR